MEWGIGDKADALAIDFGVGDRTRADQIDRPGPVLRIEAVQVEELRLVSRCRSRCGDGLAGRRRTVDGNRDPRLVGTALAPDCQYGLVGAGVVEGLVGAVEDLEKGIAEAL